MNKIEIYFDRTVNFLKTKDFSVAILIILTNVIVCNTWKNTNDLIKPALLKKFPQTAEINFENDACKTHIYIK